MSLFVSFLPLFVSFCQFLSVLQVVYSSWVLDPGVGARRLLVGAFGCRAFCYWSTMHPWHDVLGCWGMVGHALEVPLHLTLQLGVTVDCIWFGQYILCPHLLFLSLFLSLSLSFSICTTLYRILGSWQDVYAPSARICCARVKSGRRSPTTIQFPHPCQRIQKPLLAKQILRFFGFFFFFLCAVCSSLPLPFLLPLPYPWALWIRGDYSPFPVHCCPV